MQSILGRTLVNLEQVKHGITSRLKQYKNCKVFRNLPECFEVAHYHSWIVEKESFPDCLVISSENGEGIITSFRHKIYDVTALQFHPESILTEHGLTNDKELGVSLIIIRSKPIFFLFKFQIP